MLRSLHSPSNSNATERISRRQTLALAAGMLGLQGGGFAATVSLIAPQKQEFIDPATEFQVTRWTEEASDAQLPGDLDRVMTRNDQQLLYASNRSGHWLPYLLQVPKGESLPIAETANLQPASLAFLKDEKEVIYVDGLSLVRTQLRKSRSRELYEAANGWAPTGTLRISPDDRTVAVLESKGGASRIVFVDLGSGKSRIVIETAQGSLKPLDFHPRFGLLLLDSRGVPVFQGGTPLPALAPFPAGEVLDARFDHAGGRLMYLIRSQGPPERTQLMELALPGGSHQLVANTSKFATFSPNADGSVFVGASGSIAQPLLLLLLRVTKREFSLMEHSSSQPSVVQPFFSNNSQLIFFQSDRLGKNCIFSVSVKGLVEQT
ncbi:MAG: hypothetical protein KIT83_05070 [Bryobacterales bacterium]|nr:hypothetical protein [Bryobacterales bacterium]